MGLNGASVLCSSNTQTSHKHIGSITMQVEPKINDLVGRPAIASGTPKHHSQGLEPPRGFQRHILTTERQQGTESGNGTKWNLAQQTTCTPASKLSDWESPYHEPLSPIQQASRLSDSSCQLSSPKELPLNICHLPILTSLDRLSLRPLSKLRVAVMIRAIALEAERWRGMV